MQEMTWLEKKVLMALGDGSETTLLVLQLVNAPGGIEELADPLTEVEIVEALAQLEADGMVSSRTERWNGPPEPRAGVPEWAEGRPQVLWWGLTQTGKAQVEQEVRRRGQQQ